MLLVLLAFVLVGVHATILGRGNCGWLSPRSAPEDPAEARSLRRASIVFSTLLPPPASALYMGALYSPATTVPGE